MSPHSRPSSTPMTRADHPARDTGLGWTRADGRRRQLDTGLRMTPAERIAWLEETLDELLPLLGRARDAVPPPERAPGVRDRRES